ncbi:VP9 [Liao ning virus]|uniref:VP9 n=1 Tax=Liao ning virus TaxID=246280 RepID=Q2TV11_9REOV|nr:VP9 [Liao ning virus]
MSTIGVLLRLSSLNEFITYCKETELDGILQDALTHRVNGGRMLISRPALGSGLFKVQDVFTQGTPRVVRKDLIGLVHSVATYLMSGVGSYCGSVDAWTRSLTIWDLIACKDMRFNLGGMNMAKLVESFQIGYLTLEQVRRLGIVIKLLCHKIDRPDNFTVICNAYPTLKLTDDTWNPYDVSSFISNRDDLSIIGTTGLKGNPSEAVHLNTIWLEACQTEFGMTEPVDYNAIKVVNGYSLKNQRNSTYNHIVHFNGLHPPNIT